MSIESYNAELSVLSTILNRPEQGWYSHVSRVAGVGSRDFFLDPRNQAIYEALTNIYASGGVPNTALVADKLSKVSDIFDSSPEEYIENIRMHPIIIIVEQMDTVLNDLDNARSVRKQIRGMEELLKDMDDPGNLVDPAAVAERLKRIVDDTKVRTTTQTFAELAQEIENLSAPMWNVTTGIKSVDNVLGGKGLESGCFTLVAARAKVGKTIFLNNLLINLLRAPDQEDKGVVIPIVLNFETKKVEFEAKVLSRHIADPTLGWGIIKRYLSKEAEALEEISQEHREKIEEGKKWALEQHWFTEFDKNFSMSDIHALVSKVKAQSPENARIVLLVDYIQLQVSNARYEREEITQLSRFYKKLAGELEISVLSLAQLNRDSAGVKPKVSDLRGSGSLEQDADSIIMLYNPIAGEDGNDEDTWKYEVMVEASTTRLAAGDDFRLQKIAENQLMQEINPSREAELRMMASSSQYDDISDDVF